MLRNGATRLAWRSLGAPATRVAPGFRNTAPTAQWTTQFGSLASKRPTLSQLTSLKPTQAALMRRGISDAQKKDEERYAHEKLKATPETVSSTSSTHAMFGEVGDRGGSGADKNPDMAAGLKHDVVCES